MRQSRRRCSVLMLLLVYVLLSAPVVFAQYGGPSILSRGGNQPGRRGRTPVSFTGYLGTGYRYDTGLIAPVLNENGHLDSASDQGFQVEGGVYGGHDFHRSSIGVDYRGDYRWQQ